MANISFAAVLKKHFSSCVLAGLLIAALGFVLLIATSARYEVRTDYLVSQQATSGQDYYTLARSSDYIGKVLSEVVVSEKFINAVVETGKINANALPFEKRDRLREWSQMVRINREADLGIVKVTVLGDSNTETQKTAQAIADVLIQRNQEFLGTGDQGVKVSILSGPLVERNPGISEIVSVLVSGFVCGFVLVALLLYIKKERREKKENLLDF